MGKMSVADLIAAAEMGAGDASVTVTGTYERVVEQFYQTHDSGGRMTDSGWRQHGNREPVVILGFTTAGIIVRRETGIIDCQPFGITESAGEYSSRRRSFVRLVQEDPA